MPKRSSKQTASLIARRGKSIAPIKTGSDLPERKRFPILTRDENGPRSYLGHREELQVLRRQLRAERRDLIRQWNDFMQLSARERRAAYRDDARQRLEA